MVRSLEKPVLDQKSVGEEVGRSGDARGVVSSRKSMPYLESADIALLRRLDDGECQFWPDQASGCRQEKGGGGGGGEEKYS